MRVERDGEEIAARLTTDNAASSYGQPVLVIDGMAYGTADAEVGGIRLVSATADERAELARAGYRLKGDGR